MADSTVYRAKRDLVMPNNGVTAHTEGSEFVSTAEQVKTFGWDADVEKVAAKNASPVVLGSATAGEDKSK